jgi:undecaprenyl-diphosphatase
MNLIQIAILAIIQGLAELLPVSSSAHVILTQKLMGLDPSAPEMTFLLVMLHTGTMFAVLVYFWNRWKRLLSGSNSGQRFQFVRMLLIATAFTGVIGFGLKFLIERIVFEKMLGHAHGEVEHLFKILPLMGGSLFFVGVLIAWAGTRENQSTQKPLDTSNSALIGIIQGLCLPFRGFSRSGATISTGLFLGLPRLLAEEFSFALAVLLTPPVIVLQVKRLLKSQLQTGSTDLLSLFGPGLLGMGFSFIAGLFALRWLSSWLEKGRWKYFGYYCMSLSALTFLLWKMGF